MDSDSARKWSVHVVLLHGHGSRPSNFDAVAQVLRAEGFVVEVPRGSVTLPDDDFAWWEDGTDVADAATAWADLAARLGIETGPTQGSGQNAPDDEDRGEARSADSGPYGDDEDMTDGSRGVARLVLVGMSQGGALALAGLFSAEQVVAAVCVGGFLPEGVEPRRGSGPVLVVHGESDEVVDLFHAELACRVMRRAEISVTEIVHEGGHVWPEMGAIYVTEFVHLLDA